MDSRGLILSGEQDKNLLFGNIMEIVCLTFLTYTILICGSNICLFYMNVTNSTVHRGFLLHKISASRKPPNKACTRRWGFWRDSKHFSTPQPFFQSDGVPPPAPARVTQTVSPSLCNLCERQFITYPNEKNTRNLYILFTHFQKS